MKEGHLKKNLIEISTLALLMFVTYYLIMRDHDFNEVINVLAASSKVWLFTALAVMGIYVFCGGYCIRVLMQGLGRHVSVWQCFKYSFTEIYFSAITPSSTGGQPMQLYYMNKDGLPVSDSAVVLLVIAALYKGAFMIITLLLFVFNTGFITEKIISVWPLALFGVVCNLAFITFLYLVLFSKKLVNVVTGKLVRILARLHIIKDADEKLETINKKLAGYHDCATFIKEHKSVVWRTFGVLTVQRLALLSVPCLVYLSFRISGYTLFEILAAQCLLNLCVDLLPIPGAVGISETVFFMLFTPIFSESRITTAVLLSRGISFYAVVIIAGIVVCGVKIAEIVRENSRVGNAAPETAPDTKPLSSEEETKQ